MREKDQVVRSPHSSAHSCSSYRSSFENKDERNSNKIHQSEHLFKRIVHTVCTEVGREQAHRIIIVDIVHG